MWDGVSGVGRVIQCGTGYLVWDGLSSVGRGIQCGTGYPVWDGYPIVIGLPVLVLTVDRYLLACINLVCFCLIYLHLVRRI